MAKIQTNPQNWKFVGGRLCLDFVNTVGGRAGATVLRDKLVDYSDLLEWSRFAGVVNPPEVRRLKRHAAAHRKDAQQVFGRAVALRKALYRLFESVVRGSRAPASDLNLVTWELRVARIHQRLDRSGAEFIWNWDNASHALDRMLWPVTLSAADLLTSGDLSRLRQCGGHECGWMFLDTSRNRSRHWCDMKDCGNRAKVSRFRQRHQQSHR
jgi:predicted RNA-binding Zn ribbon-like protein